MTTIQKAKSLYGLAEPYNFDRALPFLLAVFFAILVGLIAVGMALAGNLSWGTFRCVFFGYLLLLAAAAAGLSFVPKWSWLLVGLCFIELTLAFGSQLLQVVHIVGYSVLPLNDKLGVPEQFEPHPLLQKVPSPGYLRNFPFFIQHDSVGLRGAERDRHKLLQQIVIATVGGSSTYDVAVPNGETWSDDLERKLGSRYAVLNHGSTGYSTAEHVIQTSFYLNSYGVIPQCAVYFVGYNDASNAYLPYLDPGYADYHMLWQERDIQSNVHQLLSRISPLARIVIPWIRYLVTSTRLPQEFGDDQMGHGRDVRLEKFYRDNLKEIVAINRDRRIATIFVGQVISRERDRRPVRKGDFYPLVPDSGVWPLVSRMNDILRDTSASLGVPSFIPPIDKFRESDFVDDVHFTPKGAEKFASMLVPIVTTNCRHQ